MKLADAPLALPAGLRNVPVRRHQCAQADVTQDWVAEEVPVALEYNGIAHAVMLATPGDLEDFALGFSFTEGIVAAPSDVRGIEVVTGPQGITIQLEIASSCLARLKERRRSLAGRTGCGLCGTENLAEALRRPAPLQSAACIDRAAVTRALEALCRHQPLHEATGGVHAACFASADGAVVLVREDVGRHNALDKLVGAMLRAGSDPDRGFIAVTSRASYEMASKTVHARVPLLAAVSGVTGLAIDVASEAGLCLAGFVRGEGLTLYAHGERLV